MQPRLATFVRLLGLVMLVVTLEIVCVSILAFNFTGFLVLTAIQLILFLIAAYAFIASLYLASKHFREQYPDSPVTLLFSNIILSTLMFLALPPIIENIFKMYAEMGQSLPSYSRFLIGIVDFLYAYKLLPFPFLFAGLIFLAFTHPKLSKFQEHLQYLIFILLIGVILFCAFSLWVPSQVLGGEM